MIPDTIRDESRRRQYREARVGGARRDRTDDLLRARQALSQLSYGPVTCPSRPDRAPFCEDRGVVFATHSLLCERTRNEELRKMVGLGRFELPTSPLSGVRSNQLSYRPSGLC